MPANDEKRKIAEDLRKGVEDTKYLADFAFLDWLYETVGQSEDGELLTRLADLVDPGPKVTCMMVYDQMYSNMYNTTMLRCSRCCRAIPDTPADSYKLCPMCGAEVVSKNESH